MKHLSLSTFLLGMACLLGGLSSSTQAADDYWVVGGTGGNVYFVPQAGSFGVPNDHEAELLAVTIGGDEYASSDDWPITINPTSATTQGDRLPGPGSSIALAPTDDPDNAGECKIRLKFIRDNISGVGPKTFISVDKWVVVGVTITEVERDPGLPNSVALTKTYDVTATITPSLAGSGHDVQFDIIGGSEDNGTAMITANGSRTATGTVTVEGGNQTGEGHAGNLKVRARLDGSTKCGESAGFSVCAHPSTIWVTFDSIDSPLTFAGKKYWGASYSFGAWSDSDLPSELNKTKISEVIVTHSATGFYAGIGTIDSKFQTTTAEHVDHHVTGNVDTAAELIAGLEEADNTGTKVTHQFFIFSCARCGITESQSSPKVQSSGFKIIRHISKEDGKHYINVTKQDFGNNGTSSGQSFDTETKKAEVKD